MTSFEDIVWVLYPIPVLVGWILVAVKCCRKPITCCGLVLTNSRILRDILILLAIVYTILTIRLLFSYGLFTIIGSFFSRKGVTWLFSNSDFVTWGWIHIVTSDLALGAFALCSVAERTQLSPAPILGIIFLMLMFGPLGLLVLILSFRNATKQRLDNNSGVLYAAKRSRRPPHP